jgi:signal transduction histidine kinase
MLDILGSCRAREQAMSGSIKAQFEASVGSVAAGSGAILRAMDDKRRLRVLHIEDSELDHALTVTQLSRGDVKADVLRIETQAEFDQAMQSHWDAILSDFNLPGFSGLAALEALKASGRMIPFILVSGEMGEDQAVEAMRNGASDYLLKSNLTRLAPAMLHAIEATETRRARVATDLALEESKQRLSQLAQHLQTSVEAERAAIAREIHDDVGGSLTALKFDLAWIARRTESPEIRQRAASALETVTHAIEASQRVMHNLRPVILEQGLVAALQWMTGRFEKRNGIPCIFRTSHEQMQLPGGVPLVAYRTAQEALTNVSKYSHAKRVEVDLAIAGGILSLEVSDDGCGLSQADLGKERSFGIRGLHERAGTVGGWVELSSGPGGTTLILSVPLQQSPSSDSDAAAEPERYDPTAWGDL